MLIKTVKKSLVHVQHCTVLDVIRIIHVYAINFILATVKDSLVSFSLKCLETVILEQ